jgi:hypothetical protein
MHFSYYQSLDDLKGRFDTTLNNCFTGNVTISVGLKKCFEYIIKIHDKKAWIITIQVH